jgi:hypothetical protein
MRDRSSQRFLILIRYGMLSLRMQVPILQRHVEDLPMKPEACAMLLAAAEGLLHHQRTQRLDLFLTRRYTPRIEPAPLEAGSFF